MSLDHQSLDTDIENSQSMLVVLTPVSLHPVRCSDHDYKVTATLVDQARCSEDIY